MKGPACNRVKNLSWMNHNGCRNGSCRLRNYLKQATMVERDQRREFCNRNTIILLIQKKKSNDLWCIFGRLLSLKHIHSSVKINKSASYKFISLFLNSSMNNKYKSRIMAILRRSKGTLSKVQRNQREHHQHKS